MTGTIDITDGGNSDTLNKGVTFIDGIICSFYVALCYPLYQGTAVWPSQDTTDHIHLLLRLSSLDNIRLETFPLLTWHEFLNSPFGFQCIKVYKKFMYGCHYYIKQKSKKENLLYVDTYSTHVHIQTQVLLLHHDVYWLIKVTACSC